MGWGGYDAFSKTYPLEAQQQETGIEAHGEEEGLWQGAGGSGDWLIELVPSEAGNNLQLFLIAAPTLMPAGLSAWPRLVRWTLPWHRSLPLLAQLKGTTPPRSACRPFGRRAGRRGGDCGAGNGSLCTAPWTCVWAEGCAEGVERQRGIILVRQGRGRVVTEEARWLLVHRRSATTDAMLSSFLPVCLLPACYRPR
jgi:hypothetical protein